MIICCLPVNDFFHGSINCCWMLLIQCMRLRITFLLHKIDIILRIVSAWWRLFSALCICVFVCAYVWLSLYLCLCACMSVIVCPMLADLPAHCACVLLCVHACVCVSSPESWASSALLFQRNWRRPGGNYTPLLWLVKTSSNQGLLLQSRIKHTAILICTYTLFAYNFCSISLCIHNNSRVDR